MASRVSPASGIVTDATDLTGEQPLRNASLLSIWCLWFRIEQEGKCDELKEFVQGSSERHERENAWSEVIRGERYIIRISSAETNGAYSMLEVVADPRNGVPMHVHDNEEEHFIILEGKAFIANGDSRAEVPAGSSITISRGVPHAWCNPSEHAPLRMLVLFSPGGLEELFRKHAGTEPAAMAALAAKFGTRITGPALFDNLYTMLSPRPDDATRADL